jgi:hypothetical protein
VSASDPDKVYSQHLSGRSDILLDYRASNRSRKAGVEGSNPSVGLAEDERDDATAVRS